MASHAERQATNFVKFWIRFFKNFSAKQTPKNREAVVIDWSACSWLWIMNYKQWTEWTYSLIWLSAITRWRPEGATSIQPRATPWVQTAIVTLALKGQKHYYQELLPFQGVGWGVFEYTQGVALGYNLLAFQAVCRMIADNHNIYPLSINEVAAGSLNVIVIVIVLSCRMVVKR